MDLINPLLAPVRTLLKDESPLKGLEEIQEHILKTGRAIEGATQSIDGHVAVLETLTTTLNETLPALTKTLDTTLPELVAAVQRLGDKLEIVSEALAPVVAAEEELGKVGHLFSRHKSAEPPADQ
jgi:hypothetical protein